jgi:hypothetical protein
MTDAITEEPHFKPYDDNYVLVSKRRFIASNNCIASMANYVSGLTNTPKKQLISEFVKKSINIVEAQTQSEIDQQIAAYTAIHNQQPNKSA